MTALWTQWAGPLTAFVQVVMIDLTMAGDNAVAVAMATQGLPPEKHRRAITIGLAGAVVMLIGFALVAVQLLKIIGLLAAGGALLLWIAWRMWRDLRAQGDAAASAQGVAKPAHPKTMAAALFQILVADLSLSLDNVLGVAGAAREHPMVLVFGLLLSITVTGFAAAWIARILHRARWLGYVGLAIVLVVALNMIWDGARDLESRLHAPPNRAVHAAMSVSSILRKSTSGVVIVRPAGMRASSAAASAEGHAGG